jgi:hypothetical protein
MSSRAAFAVSSLIALALGPGIVRAEDTVTTAAEPAATEGDGLDFSMPVALKTSLLVSRAPDAPMLFAERDTAAALWRFRIAPELRLGEHVALETAYEHRLRIAPDSAMVGLAVLPPEVDAPYRLVQLDGELASSPTYAWRHELDRFAVAMHTNRLDITAGRQAIGWGRGVVFSAVDLFAPFSALEIDREWRRGVDALHAEVMITDTVSTDAVAALGPSIDESVFAARARGYRGEIDVELVAGWRARDLVAGITSSAAIGDSEVHGELAAFRTPEPVPVAGPLGDRYVLKAVLGGSYRFAWRNGIPIVLEYHYSGFGVVDAEDVVPLLADPAFRARFERGDTQILGRHAIVLSASYEVSPELSTGVRYLQSPRDGSGVVMPTATVTLGDRLTLLGAFYVPWGAAPVGLELKSEYGTAGITGFFQLVATY